MAEKKKFLNIRELNLGKNEVSMSELEKLAEQGDQFAMHKLIELYSPAATFFSNQPERNPAQAFKWVKKLEELGDRQARHWLADCYFTGEHVEKRDWDKAIALLKQSATEGDVRAWVRLAYYYSHGNGVEKDFIQAIEWLKKIAEYEDSGNFSLYQSFLFEQARSNPHQLCRKFSYFYEEPRYKLADCYFQGGYGIEKNLFEAVKWLEKAIEWPEKPYAENCRAQLKLGECYLQGGYGLEQNVIKAVEWFEKAAGLLDSPYLSIHGDRQEFTSDGSRLAQRKLGFHYLKEENYTEAVKWFEEAVHSHPMEYGFGGIGKEAARAKTELGICYYHAKDYDSASEIFKLPCSIPTGDDCFWQLWLAYFIYQENKPAAEKITGWERPLCKSGRLENPRAEEVRNVIENEKKIAEYLHMAALGLFFSDEATNSEYLDIIRFAFHDDVICFLEQDENSPAKVILAFYYRCQKKHEKYIECLIQASKQDILANYLLGKYYKDSEYFDKATHYFNQVDKVGGVKYLPRDVKEFTLSKYPLNAQQFLAYSAKEELNNIKHQEEIEVKNKQLQEAQKELEDMMSMFAHKFRSPLDVVIYNTTHENQVKLYTEAAQTMRGLLNIFSIISTDSEILKDKIKQDGAGNGRLATTFSKILYMILLHLLSVSGAEKIQQHYMAYAKVHGLCDAEVSYKTWCEDYYELEQALQAKWEQSFALLLNQSATLEQHLAWLEQHFFKLELIGFERDDIQFKEYGVTESFLTILLNEILVNAFKYYSSASKQPVVLEWTEREGYQMLICRNPSIRSERATIKGSHKGQAFLSTLARNTGSAFTKPRPQDDFVVEFGIPDELLISK
jgi:TPR repeat protein